KEETPYPSVPDARGSAIGSGVTVGAATTVGLSVWLCAVLPIATVEIACLKINCSWLLVSSTTEYLSKERIRPVNFTPLNKYIVMLVFSLRAVLRKESWMFCAAGLFSIPDLLGSSNWIPCIGSHVRGQGRP